VAVTVAGARDDLAAAPGDGPLAEMPLAFGGATVDVRKILQVNACQQVQLYTMDPANPVILRIDQAAGFLRCRFQWCGQYSREFIVPL
jgi:hypothetical protein